MIQGSSIFKKDAIEQIKEKFPKVKKSDISSFIKCVNKSNKDNSKLKIDP